MNLRLPSSPTIRHHIRAVVSRIPFVFSLPHQWTNILLLLPVLVFLTLYIYNERQSAAIKTELEYERVVWPQYFGFPQWYGKPELPSGSKQEQSKKESSDLPWNQGQIADDSGRPIIRVLGVIPSNPCLHQQAAFLSHLADVGPSFGFNVTLRSREEVEETSECWDWIWKFGSAETLNLQLGCDPIIINEPDLSNRDLDLAQEVRSNITLLTEANNDQIRSILNILYGESYKYTNNPPQLPHFDSIGLIDQSTPSADPFTFFPDRGMSGWKRKRVTIFLGRETQKRVTEELGRKQVLEEHLPSGWTVFFEHDPLRPSKWQSLFGQKVPEDWEATIALRLRNDRAVAETMRHSGICVFEEDWFGDVLSHRMVQAMLSGCVVATATPSVFKKAIPDFVIPLDPLKLLQSVETPHGSIQQTLLPQLIQISGIISAYTPQELDEKALRAFMFASERFTTQRKLTEMVALVKTWQEGGRGLQLPGGYHDAA